MTRYNEKGSLRAEGLLSNGYSNFETTRKVLSGKVDQDFVNVLVGDKRVLQTETQADIMFVSPFINSLYRPFAYRYFSVVRNDANPDVELFAVEEQSFLVQSGFQLGAFDLGVQLRSQNIKFVRKRMKLLSLATQAGQDSLKPKTQSGLYLEPAVTWNIPVVWSPRISLIYANGGLVSERYSDLRNPEELELGFGVSPLLPVGRLDLLVDYKSLNYEETPSEKWHFGALMQYGVMNLAAGLDANGGSLGIYYGLEQVNSGILFSTTRLPWRNDDEYTQTVYVQVGWQL